MNCNHDFVKMPDERKAPARAKVVCAFCGQVRLVWSDGSIEVTRESGSIRHPQLQPAYDAG